MTTISLSQTSPAKIRTDALIVGVVSTDQGPQVASGGEDVTAAFGRGFGQTLGSLGVKGSSGEVTKLPGAGAVKADVVVLVGLGPAAEVTAESLRRSVGTAVRGLSGAKTAALAVPADSAERVGAIAEGVLLGGYTYDRYLTGEAPTRVEEVTLLTALARGKGARAELERAQAVADAVNAARTWTNTPPADLTPAIFADEIVDRAKGTSVKVDVLDETKLAAQGYGGILGVGRGSANPPRLVTLTYKPRKPAAHICFVGKGITFDSGGISLKPGSGMYTMKCDMAGAAAVVAATLAIAELGLPVQVTTYASLAENMPSGTATRPGDVLTMYGGKTVEVLNTDAEGRLVLADALATASALDPDVLVDVATLTGACVIALGHRTSGIMANDDQLRAAVHSSAESVGETMWPMPLPEEIRAKVHDSKVADLAQIQTDKAGGSLYAGAFLREFVGEGIAWAHLDIAGTAFNDGAPWGYTPRGGTGAAVRTLVRLAADRT
ncbi:MAG TPA: leucyl aminopeptidase [Nocardioidaceae bacterium]|nr:leucyl aminopeptidase [Nocardioidaceae bacterium]